jgi:RHH-type rel operon transcriptional repressor/antitoxin RelB
MAISVRMDPLLEMQLEQAAKRQGITKSQFIIEAVKGALGRKNTYELMLALKAKEEQKYYGPNANPADIAWPRPLRPMSSRTTQIILERSF